MNLETIWWPDTADLLSYKYNVAPRLKGRDGSRYLNY